MILPWPLRLGFYSFTIVLIGSYYDSWSTTSGTLVRMGVYENLCTEQEICDGEFAKAKCPEQQAKIAGLLSVFRITEFTSSMAIGVFLDVVGPKICIIIGIVLRMCAWLILSLFPRTPWIMIIACLTTGLSHNAVVFPVYTIGRYWLAYQDIGFCVISISLGVGCFYTFVVNNIMDAIPNLNVPLFIAIKLTITHLPLLIISAFIFPNNIVKDIRENLTESMALKNREKNLEEVVEDTGPWKLKNFLSYVILPEILVIAVIFIHNCVSLTFAQETFTQVYENDKFAENFNSVMLPAAALFSLMFMWIINRFGVMIVIVSVNCVSVMMHISLLFSSTTASIFATIGITVTISGFITFFYILLEKLVEIKYSGSIKGYVTTAAGISLVINPALNEIVKSRESIKICQSVFIFLRTLVLIPLLWLLRKERMRWTKKRVDKKICMDDTIYHNA